MKKIIYYCLISLSITVTVNAQKINKDTLFFKFDKNYISNSKAGTGNFTLKDSHRDGTFFFKKMEILTNLKPEKKLCLKKYVRNSEYYDKSRKRKLYDYGLYDHLRNYTIFLVKGKEYIKVKASYEIE